MRLVGSSPSHVSPLLGLAIALSASGCAVGPDYVKPSPPVPEAWVAVRPHGGDPARLLSWWASFGEPDLIDILRAAEETSPTLASAAAKIASARATLASSASGGLPSLTGTASATRQNATGGTGDTVVSTSRSGELDASWEIDLFGKVRRTLEADRARIDARVADWHDGRVSLAAEVADDFVQYKACRVLEATYASELASQRETLRATSVSASSGLTSTSDLALARATVASAASTLIDQQTSCDILVKSLVTLSGLQEAELRRHLDRSGARIPHPAAVQVLGVPAEIIEQRPDVVALEREVAATSAEIGKAEADRLPSLSLSGSISVSGSTISKTVTPWSFGPTLSVPLFDGGKREAAVTSAEASYAGAVASWRSGIRTAIGEVEQALVRLDGAQRRTGHAATAATQYRTYLKAVDSNWRAGGVSLLTREEARRSAQSADVTLIEVRRDQVRYWIALYKALGGAWHSAAPAIHESAPAGRSPTRS